MAARTCSMVRFRPLAMPKTNCRSMESSSEFAISRFAPRLRAALEFRNTHVDVPFCPPCVSKPAASDVPPRSFRPPPKVTSAVVRLDVLPSPAADVASEEDFFTVVRAGFAAPRKQLRNSLSQGLRIEPVAGGRILADAGVDATRRPQTLDIAEWAGIYQVWARSSHIPEEED